MFNLNNQTYQLFSKLKLVLYACLVIFIPLKPLAQKQKPYNVIYILVDDMNNRVNYLGFPQVLTPNLQRLINKGVSFTNAFAQFPLCNPSRTSLLSGWRPDKTNVLGNNQDPGLLTPPGASWLQEYLHSFGYRTERYGKIYHSQYEYEFSWDYTEGRGGGGDFTLDKSSGTSKNYPGGSWGIYPGPDTTIEDYILAKDLTNRLKQPSSQPLFLALGITAHNPFVPAINHWNIYGDSTKKVNLPYWESTQTVPGNSSNNIALPNTPANDLDDIPEIAIIPDNVEVKTDSDWQKTIQGYYAEVSAMDRNIGLVFDEMDRQNLWSNTIVVFTSDHGQHLGEHQGVWRKNTLFEESLKVPLVIYAPGLSAGTCDKMVEMVDIYPTITELCKVPTPAGLEGASMVRLMQNPNQTWKKASFSQLKAEPNYPLIKKCEAVHYENLHYNYWGTYGEELYDRNADPNEYVNLVTDPNYATVLDTLRLIRQQGWRNALPPACDTIKYYKDNDGDGYGNSDSMFKGCYQPAGYVNLKNDCNDSNAAINPGATEICDGIDNNCNGKIDENTVSAIVTPAGTVTICSGTSVKLSAVQVAGATYQWLNNGAPIARGNSRTLTVKQAGLYRVIVNVNNRCIDTSRATEIVVNPTPAAKITPLDNLNICALGSVRLRANAVTDVTYQWKKNGTDIAGATSRLYTANTAGTYQVAITSSAGCSKLSSGATVTSSCFAISLTNGSSLETITIKGNELVVFPNPAKDNVSLRFNAEKSGNVQMKIINAGGQEIITRKLNAVKGSNTFNIRLGGISAGIYYVEITGNDGLRKSKFIVE